MKFSVEHFDADGDVTVWIVEYGDLYEVGFRGIVEDMQPGDTVTITRTDAVQPVQPVQTEWCDTCGNQVIDRKCYCWLSVAETLERYLGMDSDHAADVAANMWAAMTQDQREYVWSAQYADSHGVMTYPNPDKTYLGRSHRASEDSISRAYDNGRRDERNGCGTE